MINKNERQLLKYLAKKRDWAKSFEIISNFNYSIRTLRSLVKSINNKSGEEIIRSSNKGYRLCSSRIIYETIISEKNIKQITKEGRRELILQELIRNPDGVDYFELAEQLNVSEQTILSDISSVRKKIAQYDISIKKSDFIFSIESSIEVKKQLISDLIFSGTIDNVITFESPSSLFMEVDTTEVNKILEKSLENFNLVPKNDFKHIEMVLHLSLLIDYKFIQHESENQTSGKILLDKDIFYHCAIDLIDKLSAVYNIQFYDYDKLTIYSLLEISTKHKNFQNDFESVVATVSEDLISFVTELVKQVYKEFSLDLESSNFINNFALHLHELLTFPIGRLKNPHLFSIKNIYPDIYEVAVYIVTLIKQKFENIDLSEDETSYIALHVGVALEEKSKLRKIRAIIVNFDYLNLNNIIKSKIESRFLNEIEIIDFASDLNSLNELVEEENIELIISTIPLENNYKCVMANVSIFINQKDIELISDMIQIIREKLHNPDNLSLVQYFDGSFKIFKDTKKSWQEIIKKLCDQCVDLDSTFYDRVILREELSSTEYLNMVIAHPIACSEKETFIMVGVFDRPYKWQNNYVDIIFLLSVSENDKEIFLKILSRLVTIFSSIDWQENKANITNYDKFIDFLVTL